MQYNTQILKYENKVIFVKQTRVENWMCTLYKTSYMKKTFLQKIVYQQGEFLWRVYKNENISVFKMILTIHCKNEYKRISILLLLIQYCYYYCTNLISHTEIYWTLRKSYIFLCMGVPYSEPLQDVHRLHTWDLEDHDIHSDWKHLFYY